MSDKLKPTPDPANAPTVVRKPEIATGPPASSQNDPDKTVVRKNTEPSARPHIEEQGERFGDYELIEEIARGGMGVIYKARHTKLNRIVAMKMILAGRLAGDDEVRRFYNEAEAAARLQHANIVAIHDVGVVNEQHYFSMEYIDGCCLTDLLREGPLPADEAATHIRTIAEAIEYAHSQGILHRDLKPHNVLIDANGQPQITDFGLAKQIEVEDGLTATGMILGTPNYMSPEQASARHDQIGPATDVYALGAMLFELITGRPPFQADQTAAVIFDVIESEPPPPSSLNPNVPRDLETICLKCLAKDPAQRYASAAALSEDLDLFLRSEPINARPLSTIGRVLRWSRHRPFLATVYGAGSTLYLFHLISLAVLRNDPHLWQLHWMVTGLMVGWLLLATVVDPLLKIPGKQVPAAFAFIALTAISTSVGFAFDRGPSSAPIDVLLVIIAIAPLLAPSARLIVFATLTAMACFLALVMHAAWFQPENSISNERVGAFLASQVAMGLIAYLWARRVRVAAVELSSGAGRTGASGVPTKKD